MVRLIVGGDAHGNDVAYEAYINEVFATYGKHISAFIDTGDNCTDFLWGEEINQLQLKLSEKFPFFAVGGNRESGFVKQYYNTVCLEKKEINWDLSSSLGDTLIACQSMTESTLKRFATLPNNLLITFHKKGQPETKINVEGINHKSLEIDDEVIPTPIFIQHKGQLTPEVNEVLKENGIELIICGHTHETHLQTYDNYKLFNPGSIGNTDRGIPGLTFGIIEFKNGHWLCQTKEIDYDRDKLIEKIKAVPQLFTHCKNWGTALIASVKSGVNVTALYMFEKNRLNKEYALNGEKANLNPLSLYENIFGQGRYANVGPNGQQAYEDYYISDNGSISTEKIYIRTDEGKAMSQNFPDFEGVYEIALRNVEKYLDLAKENSSIENEVYKGRRTK